jgi:hypothetical protein
MLIKLHRTKQMGQITLEVNQYRSTNKYSANLNKMDISLENRIKAIDRATSGYKALNLPGDEKILSGKKTQPQQKI